jgi:hypothetical protein
MRSDVARSRKSGLVLGPPIKGMCADLQDQAHAHKHLIFFFVKLMGGRRAISPNI